MNAIEFVKKKGINYAIKFLNYDPSICGDACELDFDETDKLKQIVEAFELVERFGGFDKSNKMLKKAYDNCSSIISIRKIGFECSYSGLQEAINLVERCK